MKTTIGELRTLARTNPIYAEALRKLESKEGIDTTAQDAVSCAGKAASSRFEPENGQSDASGVRFTIPGQPVGKPRQTRADVWKKRPCVLRYREWADRARASAPANLPKEPMELEMNVWLAIPASWSAKKRKEMAGRPHRQKADLDNISKSVFDALFPSDECIAILRAAKFWDDGIGPRVDIYVR